MKYGKTTWEDVVIFAAVAALVIAWCIGTVKGVW